MAQEKENFLGRWSRLKTEQKQADAGQEKAVAQKAEERAPELPPLDKLTPQSDFAPFMNPKVQDALRRAALKKLFSDPHFNVPDPYEAYSGDWTVGEPISEELLAQLNQARTLLFSDKDKQEKQKEEEQQQQVAEDQPKKADEPGRQDT